MDRPTYSDLFQVARNQLLIANPRLTAVDREGSDANALVASIAAVGDEVSQQVAYVAAASFLDTAQGTALDRLVFDRYGLVRKPAAAALGTVQFTSAAGAASTFGIPENTLLTTSDGVQFQTTEPVTFPIGSNGPISAPVRSVLAGATQQVRAGTIVAVVSPIGGAPADLAVTNALATSGAADPESDNELRERARRFFTTVQRGTLAAIEQAARGVPGVRYATAFEDVDQFGAQSGYVSLVVTDQYTDTLATLSSVPATYQEQSQVLAQQVALAVDQARAAGIYVATLVAQVILQPVTLRLRVKAGYDSAAVALQARAVCVQVVNALPPGAELTVASLEAALANVQGLYFVGDEVIVPAATIAPTPLQVLRTNLQLVVTGG
jgi:uncharacterized phage protein gp47/JayE